MSLMPIADVASWLKYPATPTGAEGTKLQATIDAAEGYLAAKKSIGDQLVAHPVTQRAPGGWDRLVLTTLPVISVTSVTDSGGQALNMATLDVDTAAGLIGFAPTGFGFFIMPFYTVVYQAGFANLAALPPLWQQAIREITREFWGAQRGGSVQSAGGPPDDGGARAEADRIIAALPSYGFA